MPIFNTLDLPDFMFACLTQYLGVPPPSSQPQDGQVGWGLVSSEGPLRFDFVTGGTSRALRVQVRARRFLDGARLGRRQGV
jgi:hypothetical protein